MQLAAIAGVQGLPQSFLAKIFQKFTQYGLVRSFRGATRGYTLSKPAAEISLREVLEAIEGPEIFDHCIFMEPPLCRRGSLYPSRGVETDQAKAHRHDGGDHPPGPPVPGRP